MNEQKPRFFQGHAGEIAALLRQEAKHQPAVAVSLLSEAGYFENYMRQMDYMELHVQGWVIGSGMVESSGK